MFRSCDLIKSMVLVRFGEKIVGCHGAARCLSPAEAYENRIYEFAFERRSLTPNCDFQGSVCCREAVPAPRSSERRSGGGRRRRRARVRRQVHPEATARPRLSSRDRARSSHADHRPRPSAPRGRRRSVRDAERARHRHRVVSTMSRSMMTPDPK